MTVSNLVMALIVANFLLMLGGIVGGTLLIRHTMSRVLQPFDRPARQQNGHPHAAD